MYREGTNRGTFTATDQGAGGSHGAGKRPSVYARYTSHKAPRAGVNGRPTIDSPHQSYEGHRPPVAKDVVRRRELHARLDEGQRLVVSFVSAPAGYGKSTLISHWLESADSPSAWLSLEESDNDLVIFLNRQIQK